MAAESDNGKSREAAADKRDDNDEQEVMAKADERRSFGGNEGRQQAVIG